MEQLVCTICKKKLSIKSDYLQCESCDAKYPLIQNSIPLMAIDPSAHAISTIFSLWKYDQDSKLEIDSLRGNFKNTWRNIKTVEGIIAAMENNHELFEGIEKAIRPFVSIDQIKNNISLSYKIDNYAANFYLEYLIRDWCGQPESEKEIGTIETILRTALSPNHGKGRILFLGAGLGRVAYDLADLFNETYAIDSSISMAYLCQKIQQEDVTVFEINLRNAANKNSLYKEFKASSKHSSKNHRAKVSYIIGDAADMPFPGGFFSAVVSLYFTDVLPLSILVDELKRVLHPGGKFIHFGPFEYNFNNKIEMLSFDEVKEYLIKSNFMIIDEGRVLSSHCKSPISGAHRIYTNWLLKTERLKDLKIDENSILTINHNIEFVQQGLIANAQVFNLTSIKFQIGKVYKGSDPILELLMAIDGKTNVMKLFKKLETDHGYEKVSIETREKILELLRSLESKGILSVINH